MQSYLLRKSFPRTLVFHEFLVIILHLFDAGVSRHRVYSHKWLLQPLLQPLHRVRVCSKSDGLRLQVLGHIAICCAAGDDRRSRDTPRHILRIQRTNSICPLCIVQRVNNSPRAGRGQELLRSNPLSGMNNADRLINSSCRSETARRITGCL